MSDYLKIARQITRNRGLPAEQAPNAPLDTVLKGLVIELWSTAAGGLFLVADEDDARLAIERLGVQRGHLYTPAEIQRIIAVNDQAVVAEIHQWKRQFDGRLGGDRPDKG